MRRYAGMMSIGHVRVLRRMRGDRRAPGHVRSTSSAYRRMPDRRRGSTEEGHGKCVLGIPAAGQPAWSSPWWPAPRCGCGNSPETTSAPPPPARQRTPASPARSGPPNGALGGLRRLCRRLPRGEPGPRPPPNSLADPLLTPGGPGGHRRHPPTRRGVYARMVVPPHPPHRRQPGRRPADRGCPRDATGYRLVYAKDKRVVPGSGGSRHLATPARGPGRWLESAPARRTRTSLVTGRCRPRSAPPRRPRRPNPTGPNRSPADGRRPARRVLAGVLLALLVAGGGAAGPVQAARR